MKTIICKIVRGIGSPGKLWTGDQPQTGEVWELGWLQKTCPDTGATTKVLRGQKLDQTVEILEEVFGPLPTALITMGGVGSTASRPLGWDYCCDDTGATTNPDPFEGLRGWNWSGRIGGHVVLNPIMIKSGYVSRDDLPTPRQGFNWINTYSGSTLSEYVLVEQNSRHDLPVTECESISPPARRAREVGDWTKKNWWINEEDLEFFFGINLKTPGLPYKISRDLEENHGVGMYKLARAVGEEDSLKGFRSILLEKYHETESGHLVVARKGDIVLSQGRAFIANGPKHGYGLIGCADSSKSFYLPTQVEEAKACFEEFCITAETVLFSQHEEVEDLVDEFASLLGIKSENEPPTPVVDE